MKHNVVYVFVILVDDDYCVAIHDDDLAPVLTALFSIELGGFNSQHISCWKLLPSVNTEWLLRSS